MPEHRGDSAEPVRVICVDDNADILKAISYMLGRAAGVECIGAFTTTRDLDAAVTNLRPDVLLLDFTIPGESTLDVLRRFKRDHPSVGCILFSGYDDAETVAAALDAGASRCLAKDIDIDTLVEAVHGLHASKHA
jgi:DNA-binding NarL/FixJ family response regulator